MTTYLLPEAEHILDLALDRAEGLIREGRMTDAVRCLGVAVAAADLVHDSQVETLGITDPWAEFDMKEDSRDPGPPG
jgi:hypothetical protein